MVSDDLMQLQLSIAGCLHQLADIKKILVTTEQYEFTAGLRNVEKFLEQAVINAEGYTNASFQKMGKPGGKLFFDNLFKYADAKNWILNKEIIKLFEERKSQLNEDIEFTAEDTVHLIELNRTISIQEERAIEFLNYIQHAGRENDQLVKPNNLTITVLCFTDKQKYTNNKARPETNKLFYWLTFPTGELINSGKLFYKSGQAENAIANKHLEKLPLDLRDEKLCYLFFYLMHNGLLALHDLLNISKVEISLKFDYIID